MRPFLSPLSLFALLLLTFGLACTADLDESCEDGTCTTGAGSGTGGAGEFVCKYDVSGGLPCQVFTILADNCHACHTEPLAGGAPFPLLTYQDTQDIYFNDIKRWERMALVVEPNGAPRMPFMRDPLGPSQLNPLRDWFATCRAGECARGPEGLPTSSSSAASSGASASASSGSGASSSGSGL